MASAAGTRVLQDRILSTGSKPEDPKIDRSLAVWLSLSGAECPQGNLAFRQHSWDLGICRNQLQALIETQTCETDKARLLAVTAPHSDDWLNALSITACGLRLDNEAIRVSAGLRLGAKLCETHTCPCGMITDVKGLHSLSCRKSAGRVGRHSCVNDIIWRAINKAGGHAVKEPCGLVRTDGKRPDGKNPNSVGSRSLCHLGRHGDGYSGPKQLDTFLSYRRCSS